LEAQYAAFAENAGGRKYLDDCSDCFRLERIVSRYGVCPLSESLDHIGPMSRTSADCAAMLAAIAGADPRDPTALLAPVPDYVAGLAGGVRGSKTPLSRRRPATD